MKSLSWTWSLKKNAKYNIFHFLNAKTDQKRLKIP